VRKITVSKWVKEEASGKVKSLLLVRIKVVSRVETGMISNRVKEFEARESWETEAWFTAT